MTKPHEKIGPYEVVGQLATGGMAEILLARLVGSSGFERPVVVKRVLAHLAATPGMREMFVDEARILAGLRHANIVQVETLGEHENTPYLAMEYLAGESAAGLLRRLTALHRKLPLDLAAFIVAEACAGLHVAHDLRDASGATRGLVHRDVSPQNVFITYDGAVKVLDFGIAMAKDRIQRTETGQLKGKFQYMSPEQTRGDEVDRRSDVFSLGIVLHELATARTLFGRRTHLLTFQAICEEPITPPSRVGAEIPKTFDALCLRALKRPVEERFPTAAAMRKELLPFVAAGGTADEPAERLAALMQEIFADRIAEKEEMLARVREGTDIDALPRGDADELVSVPSIIAAEIETNVTASMNNANAPTRSRFGVSLTIGGALLIAVAAGGVVAMRARGARTLVEPPPAVAVASTPAAAVAVAVASVVVVKISSIPDGAKITIAGRESGVTPASVELPRGAGELDVVLEKPGYARATQTVVPDADGRLVVTLVKDRAPEPAAKPKGTPGKPRPAASALPGFEKFD